MIPSLPFFKSIQPTNIMKDTVLESSPSATERSPEYAIYKPNSRGSGGVVRFGLNPAKAAVFVEAAAQSGEKQFDWENKIIMKWGLPDLGTVSLRCKAACLRRNFSISRRGRTARSS